MTKKNTIFVALRIIAALILFVALADHPYGYYRFVRLFTFAVCGYGFYKAYSIKNKLFSWIFGIIAIVFNPLYSFYFGKDLWHIIDVLSGIITIVSVSFFKLNKKVKPEIGTTEFSSENKTNQLDAKISYALFENISKELEKKGINDSLSEFREIEKKIEEGRKDRTQTENDDIDKFMKIMKEKMINDFK